MKIVVQMSVQVPAFNSFGCIPTSARPYNCTFNFLRNCHTVFHSGHTIYILATNAQGCNFSHSSEEPTEIWQLNIMWYLGWGARVEKGHAGEIKEIWIKHGFLLVIGYQHWFFNCKK